MFKKLIKYILPALIILLILPGLVTRKVKVTTKVAVQKPIAAVYIGLADPAKLPYWFEGFQKIEHLQGMPFVPGSVYRITWERKGQTFSAVEKVVKIDWKKNLKLEMHIRGLQIDSDIYFYEIEDKTYVDGTHLISAKGLVKKILLPWAKPWIKKELYQNFMHFKEMMEAS
ncbi:MAG: SRPBCC family protein [Chlorobi bacterium]|nr:SRPBCC family protein [Chlorobiota bacterium]